MKCGLVLALLKTTRIRNDISRADLSETFQMTSVSRLDHFQVILIIFIYSMLVNKSQHSKKYHITGSIIGLFFQTILNSNIKTLFDELIFMDWVEYFWHKYYFLSGHNVHTVRARKILTIGFLRLPTKLNGGIKSFLLVER